MIHPRGGRFDVTVYDPRLKRRVAAGTYDTEQQARKHETAAVHTIRRAAPAAADRPEPTRRVDHFIAHLWLGAARRWEVHS